MKIYLIEDEPLALSRLKSLCLEILPSAVIIGEADSVTQASSQLYSGITPDLIITDIQLADGTCFDLFAQFTPQCPVIFTTAYNQYAIDAFRLNTIDYLLKPIKKEDLTRALTKFEQGFKARSTAIDYAALAKHILAEEGRWNKRYLIRYGEQIRTVESSEIAYVYTNSKSVFFMLFSGKSYPVDKSLDVLEKELNPKEFFRINRQFIVHIKSIGKMLIVSKSRVKLELNPPYPDEDVIVSTEKSPLFKEWLGGE